MKWSESVRPFRRVSDVRCHGSRRRSGLDKAMKFANHDMVRKALENAEGDVEHRRDSYQDFFEVPTVSGGCFGIGSESRGPVTSWSSGVGMGAAFEIFMAHCAWMTCNECTGRTSQWRMHVFQEG